MITIKSKKLGQMQKLSFNRFGGGETANGERGIGRRSVGQSAGQSAGRTARRRGAASGFTLVEVLAALVFMAIVIPAAVQGLQIANRAGVVGLRKTTAVQIAERVLNELVITKQWQSGAPSGVVQDGGMQYRWISKAESWNQQSVLRLLTVQVTFPVQGQEYDVRLSTVVDSTL
jgi:prepilin-type N-terminal cleavage/methylation domain-containing protein